MISQIVKSGRNFHQNRLDRKKLSPQATHLGGPENSLAGSRAPDHQEIFIQPLLDPKGPDMIWKVKNKD